MSATTRRALSFILATVLIGVITLGVLMLVTGCTPMVPSPRDPSIKIPAEQAMIEAEAIATGKQSEKRAAERRFRLAASRIQSETAIDLAELTAAFDESVEKADAEAAAILASTRAAIEAAEARQGQWVSGLGAVAGIAQSTGIPGLATIGGLLAGGLGLFSAAANKRKARTAEEIAAAKEAEAAATKEAAGRVVDSLDLLKALSPEVKAAFKQHAPALLDWQGVAGVKLVQAVQNS
jgi:hypothetical protein